MPESATRRAAAAVDDLAAAFDRLSARAGTSSAGTSITAEQLADAIRRGQSPELVQAMRRALGLQ